MTPKTALTSLFSVILFASCQPRLSAPAVDYSELPIEQTAAPPLGQIELLDLRAVNISENMSVFSTQQDEILLIAYLLLREADSLRILDSRAFQDMTFDSTHTTYSLNFTLRPDSLLRDRTLAAFLLAELDNSGTEASIKEIFDRKIIHFTEGRPPSRLAVDTLFGTDDFLDLEFIHFDQPQEASEQTLIFKGMHLFDRFEYHLRYRGQ